MRPATPGPAPDISERGAPRDGQPQTLDRRLFMQFLAYGGSPGTATLGAALADTAVEGAIYEDLNDPRGVGVLALHEDPGFFVGPWRTVLNREPFGSLAPKPEFTMFGRTYAIGYEPDLVETLFTRPRRTVLDAEWPWAVWYPLRRTGAFAQLPEPEQRALLGEHGAIGHAYGKAGLARDVRLACHGLDRHDNDFVIGLIGRRLHPLSAVVQHMRATKQTSQYVASLGPFFVGHAAWQSAL